MKMFNKPKRIEFGYEFAINKNTQKDWVKYLEDEGINNFLNGLENKYLKEDDGMCLKTANNEIFNNENLNLVLEVWEDDLIVAANMVENMEAILDRIVKGL